MIDPQTARSVYVIPALSKIKHYSLDGEKILMGTAAIESEFTFFRQNTGNPNSPSGGRALGMFQMEPDTFNWLMNTWLMAPRHKELRSQVLSLATTSSPDAFHLRDNHKFSAALARVRYLAAPGEIPSDISGQADYWWNHYNGRSPHGLKPKNYLERWSKYCAALYTTTKTSPLKAPLLPGFAIV